MLEGGVDARFYAILVTSGAEVNVATIIAERARALGLDIRSIIVPPRIKGYVILEAHDPGDVYDATRGLRHVKRRRPLILKFEEVKKLVKPEVEIPALKPGQVVEIVAGAFKGMKARVIDVNQSKGQVTVSLLEPLFRATATIPIDEVRPVEE
ncbi:transcription elongation factor Spt5 [Aeropyrum pernix]|uniref:Transcription elongation factor Spt5 n=1 Tax=Aeropyrum pernix TaxID=56636 RepID=A0A401H8K2_AERPX|nr:transcription elongation factor Spt5 [Aeropyrum pernix]